MKLIFFFLRKEKSVFCSPAPPGAPLRRGGPPPGLRGTPQNQSLPGTVPWALGSGPMPCEQMAVIVGNPETLQETRVWVFTASWSRREHQNGRPSGAWPTRGGGRGVHNPKKGEGATFFSQGGSRPAPSTQHPTVCLWQGTAKPGSRKATLPAPQPLSFPSKHPFCSSPSSVSLFPELDHRKVLRSPRRQL